MRNGSRGESISNGGEGFKGERTESQLVTAPSATVNWEQRQFRSSPVRYPDYRQSYSTLSAALSDARQTLQSVVYGHSCVGVERDCLTVLAC